MRFAGGKGLVRSVFLQELLQDILDVDAELQEEFHDDCEGKEAGGVKEIG